MIRSCSISNSRMLSTCFKLIMLWLSEKYHRGTTIKFEIICIYVVTLKFIYLTPRYRNSRSNHLYFKINVYWKIMNCETIITIQQMRIEMDSDFQKYWRFTNAKMNAFQSFSIQNFYSFIGIAWSISLCLSI